ncbi:tRNA pseudouridine(55) synthase TruB [Sphingomonas lenta]|uniref:tRNA pseudouridine synthase B n=1 Tax=Sphingomonas lenta TaxID=1141887 RepID=A0A2A2SD34_9SPHN|nr:tRNA pseudouridine(55) synthase TruB [Sphingomonas lenta]PAX07123.1 tRNA pseudouridine(55) synthase TruB [Sphingomonas lenta]
MHGWIVLDKPVGPGSTEAVTAVKRALRAGGYPKLKVGHGGTLDPLASGVLPVAIGEATKLAGRLLDSDKIYEFTIRFGEETATLDAEGEVIATSHVRPLRRDIEAVLERFRGEQDQIPPVYSALKINGQRAYELARSGQEIELATRRVNIKYLGALGMLPVRSEARLPPIEQSDFRSAVRSFFERERATHAGKYERVREVTLTAHVSKGTYIRSLARDIALALGTVGHVTMLCRTKAGPFWIHHALSLDKLTELGHARRLEEILLPLRAGLDDIPALSLTLDQAGALRQGRVLAGIAADAVRDGGQAFAMLGDTPVALVEVRDREVRVVRGFNL